MNYKKLSYIVDSVSLDAEYMEAYKDKDGDKAFKILSKAFNDAYPNNRLGARVFYKGANGEWSNKFAGYFTTDYEFAAHYGGDDVRKCFLVMESPFEYDFNGSGSDDDFEGYDGVLRNTGTVIKEADAEGSYDGYILYNVGEGYALGMYEVNDYIVRNPKQVKSAEPFTFDDNGDLIPLSMRFDSSNEDFRY